MGCGDGRPSRPWTRLVRASRQVGFPMLRPILHITMKSVQATTAIDEMGKWVLWQKAGTGTPLGKEGNRREKGE